MAKTPKRPRDPNQLAKMIVDIASGEVADLPVRDEDVSSSRRKAAEARAESMTAERRSEIARKAAAKRWGREA